MKYVFQFFRILAFCFLGELLHLLLPLPVPASVYGLILLSFALMKGIVRLEQIRETALFLTGIFPLLFVPAAAGVMELWEQLRQIIIPAAVAVVPVTMLVMGTAGSVTQWLMKRSRKEEA